MNKKTITKIYRGIKIYPCFPLLFLLVLVLKPNLGLACSMYKITEGGRTMVGCNEDAWRTSSRIWFVNADASKPYGACFTGSRRVGENRTAPQSGMNEKGLVFSRLTAYHPEQANPFTHRKTIKDEVDYLTGALHQCASIQELKHYIQKYDHSFFINDVFIYIDSTGDYLIVEPYTLIEGKDSSYVLSNFCPSVTTKEQARCQERYRKGEKFLQENELVSSLPFCAKLSEAMKVCRRRNGDGTLLTSIWNTKDKLVNLYFYHAFDSTIQFSLTEALAQGDHSLAVAEMFPENPAFERLKTYKTPFNTPILRLGLVGLGGLFTCFALWFLGILVFKSKTIGKKILLWMVILNGLLSVYLAILSTDRSVYYFDAPYQHWNSSIISAFSYLPIVLLLSLMFMASYFFRIRSLKGASKWLKTGLIANGLLYSICVGAFFYWGFYQVF